MTSSTTNKDDVGGDSEKKAAAPITKKISNVTNKLVSPVRALAKSPELRRRRLPQPSSSSSQSRADAQDRPKARNSSPSACLSAPTPPPPTPPPLPPPPSDSVLSKMNVFLNDKRIRGISMSDYCRAIWLEGGVGDYDTAGNTPTSIAQQQPFFAPWLESCGKSNICVGGWEEHSPPPSPSSSSSSSFVNQWDGEAYDRMRKVTFTTKRSGIGPSTADATQIHRLRLEGDDDRCVVSITVNMNVPFGDSFQVQVRWVVSSVGVAIRDGVDELAVSVGMLVVFSKSCFVENKIRTNTTNETIKGQTSLYESQKRRCRTMSNAKGVEVLEDDEDEEEKLKNDGTANGDRCSSAGKENMSIFQSIWSLFLILSGWRLLSFIALGFVSVFGRSGCLVASSSEDTDKKEIIVEIHAAKAKLSHLEKLLEEHDVTPMQTESAAAVVRITNDALHKLISKLND